MSEIEPTQPLCSKSLRNCFSVARLDTYGTGADTDFDKLLKYAWNLKLCESLYVPLQNFEISLRNTIDVECQKGFKMRNWTSRSLFEQPEIDAINEAKESLDKNRKGVSHDGIIAELKFSFWTSLFRKVYEFKMFRPALSNVFKFAPKSLRLRHPIFIRLDEVRDLRNRVFHHEPVWRINIKHKHDTILEMLSWIDPKIYSYTKWLDTFDEVYSKGIDQFDREELLALACESAPPLPAATS